MQKQSVIQWTWDIYDQVQADMRVHKWVIKTPTDLNNTNVSLVAHTYSLISSFLW